MRALLFALCGLPALAGEQQAGEAVPMKGKMSAHMRALGNADGEALHMQGEMSMVKEGLLGTVNVLQELDVKTWANRVKVTSNVEGNPDATIDGSGVCFRPKVDPSKPLVLTYTLPGLRTVSSLAIAYEDGGSDAPAEIQLEGSSDGGTTWFKVFKSKARKNDFLKYFKPAKVNALRLTQEGDGTDRCNRRTKEVVVYADPDSPLPLFGGKDSGAFGFLRSLWYADKLTLIWSPKNNVWTPLGAGFIGINRFPETLLFKAGFPTQHDGGFGDAEEKGKRLYLRFDLDPACPMNAGLIGMHDGGSKLGLHPAEFYTANGRLDPGTLKGSSIQDLTGQGWVLQKSWDKDPNIRKEFQFARPGRFNQMLVVWDAFKAYENDRWCRMEVFGSETAGAGGAPENPQK
jgi:hypothetical protein